MPPAYTASLDLADTGRYDPNAITCNYGPPAALPVIRRRTLSWLDGLRLLIADLLSPLSSRELAAVRAVADAAVAHVVAERHWQAHCRDRAALKAWGDAQDALATAAERLLNERGV